MVRFFELTSVAAGALALAPPSRSGISGALLGYDRLGGGFAAPQARQEDEGQDREASEDDERLVPAEARTVQEQQF